MWLKSFSSTSVVQVLISYFSSQLRFLLLFPLLLPTPLPTKSSTAAAKLTFLTSLWQQKHQLTLFNRSLLWGVHILLQLILTKTLWGRYYYFDSHLPGRKLGLVEVTILGQVYTSISGKVGIQNRSPAFEMHGLVFYTGVAWTLGSWCLLLDAYLLSFSFPPQCHRLSIY